MSRANRMSGHQRIFTRRTAVAGAVGGMLWSGLALRLAQLQLIEGEEYARRAAENRIRLDPAPAERGRIFDRFGQELASNRRNFYVTITPENVAKGGGRMDELVKRLATLLPISKSRQARILRDAARQARFLPITVADDLTWEDFSRVNVHAPELTGVEAQVGQLRSYPLGAAFAHSVGYVGRPNDQEIARVVDALDGDAAAIRRLYKHPATRIGKTGVEYFAENWLKGQSGYKRVEVNADGRIQSELDSSDISPRRGGDVVLSFDAEIQKFAMRRFGDETGSAVVLDIESGDILALASKPALDPNDFVSGISQANYDKLRFNSDAPLYHKAYDGTYPPGSTFKMVVAAAALEAGAMTPDERVYCGGKTWFGGR
ncbi:MAG: penicillin-binding transpeptidase domain-containing protein, partial [Pseudomonadota bacterium]